MYAVLSAFAAAYTLLVGVNRGDAALIVLAVWTAVIKVIVIPVAIDRQMTRQFSEHEVPLVVQVPMSLLIGVTLAGLAYWSASALPIEGALLPTPALGMPLSLVLIGFFFMITRQNVISHIVGLLVLENGVFLATVAIAPGCRSRSASCCCSICSRRCCSTVCSRGSSPRASGPPASRT